MRIHRTVSTDQNFVVHIQMAGKSNKGFVIGGVILGTAMMTCFASSCSSLLLSSNGSSRTNSRVPNIFGNANLVPNELPAALSSISCACMFYSVVCVIALIVINRTNRIDDAARRELEERLFIAMTKVQILQKKIDKETLKRVREAKTLKETEAINQQINDEKLKSGQVEGAVYDIPDFVLLGEVISEELSIADAKRRLINAEAASGIPVQMTINKKTQKAVLKSLRMPRTEFFGKEIDDSSWDSIQKGVLECNVNTMTHRCGEGYSTEYDTYVHQRFFVMNVVVRNRASNDPNSTRMGNDAWKDVDAGTLTAMRDQTKGLLKDFDGECFLGNGTWACRKQRVLSLIFGLLNSILFMVGIGTLGAGWVTSLSTLLVEGAVAGAELALSDSDGEKSVVNLIEERLGMFQDHRPISNWSWGRTEAYIMVHTRMNTVSSSQFCAECWYEKKSDLPRRVTRNKNIVCAHVEPKDLWCSPANRYNKVQMSGVQNKYKMPWTQTQQDKLLRYEGLPASPWNCDDITRRIKLSDSHYGLGGRRSSYTLVNSQTWVEVGTGDHCRDADEKFLASLDE
jgi:hypothetical protein